MRAALQPYQHARSTAYNTVAIHLCTHYELLKKNELSVHESCYENTNQSNNVGKGGNTFLWSCVWAPPLHHCCFTGSEGEKDTDALWKAAALTTTGESRPVCTERGYFFFFLSAGINLHISIVTHLPPCLNMPHSSGPNYLREAADNNCVDCEPSAPQAHRVAAKVFEQENGAGGGLEHVVMISMTVLRLAFSSSNAVISWNTCWLTPPSWPPPALSIRSVFLLGNVMPLIRGQKPGVHKGVSLAMAVVTLLGEQSVPIMTSQTPTPGAGLVLHALLKSSK